jgi:hypothetical protein
LNFRDETLRRAIYWVALVTGLALVGSQFGCTRPLATLSTSGFPHASRSIMRQAGIRDLQTSEARARTGNPATVDMWRP